MISKNNFTDKENLKRTYYNNPAKLQERLNTWDKYGTSRIKFFDWVILQLSELNSFSSVPDLISIIDLDSLLPISNSTIQLGNNVLVFGTPALPIWKTSKGIELLGPRRFGFHATYVPL